MELGISVRKSLAVVFGKKLIGREAKKRVGGRRA